MERNEATSPAIAPVASNGHSYLDWAAILAGAVIASAAGVIFAAFGAALGLSALSAEPGEGSLNLALFLTALWTVVSLVATYAIGGYIAGRMRRRVEQATPDEVTARDGINGLAVWGVGILIGAMMLGNAASSVVSGAGAVASTVVEAAGSAVGGVAEGAIAATGAAVPEGGASDAMTFVTDTLLRPATIDPANADAEALSGQIGRILANVVQTGEISDADRAYLESAVASQTGAAPADVTARVDQAIATAQSTREEAARLMEEAEQTAIDAAETARISGVLSAFLLAAAALVAAATAYISAVKGGRHRDEGRIFGGLAYRH